MKILIVEDDPRNNGDVYDFMLFIEDFM